MRSLELMKEWRRNNPFFVLLMRVSRLMVEQVCQTGRRFKCSLDKPLVRARSTKKAGKRSCVAGPKKQDAQSTGAPDAGAGRAPAFFTCVE